MTTAYPLAWPSTFPRAKKREKSRFTTTLAGALSNVRKSLEAFAKDSGKPLANVVLSSNCSLGHEKPEDPGIAVWFTWDGMQICIPCDRYLTPAENLQAIHHVLEARRIELRHGTLSLVRATMTGFTALPGPNWRETMRFTPDANPNIDEVTYRYRRLAAELHPDKPGGSHDAMARLNKAKDEAFRELGL